MLYWRSMRPIIENILILSAELFFISANASQLIKLIKTRNRKGLSAINQTLNGAGNIAWATYFFSRQLFVPFTTNLTMLAITATVLGFTLADRKQFVRGLLAIMIIGPATGMLIINYPNISGWIGVAYNFIAMMPWIIHIVRTKKTSGISIRALYFAIAAITSTLLYAILTDSAPLVIGTLIGLVLNGIVVGYYYKYRKY